MTHSTTATATHILSRYSRSYPSGPQLPKQNTESEWQHFVNPVIRLILDVKKSSKGELESFRLRVVWCMGSAKDRIADQSEVIFEDLELLSFSSVSPFQPQQATQAQGLPLKAVYREAVVGIRYLHPMVISNESPSYRRFQMTFMSPTAASQFIDSICNVCPCKANPPPIPNRSTMAPSLAPAPSLVPGGRTAQNIAIQQPGGSSTVYTVPHHIPAILPSSRPSPFGLSSTSEYALSSPMHPPTIPHSSLDMHSSSRPPSSPALLLQDISTISHSSQLPANAAEALSSNSKISGKSSNAIQSGSSNNSSLPESSPPASSLNSSSNNANLMLPPPLPSATLSIHPTTNSLITSLCEIPTLYDLPRRDLEDLVAEVVREEGFPKLLETLDSMWTVTGFLGQ